MEREWERERMERNVLPSICKQQATDAVHTVEVFNSEYSFKHLFFPHFPLLPLDCSLGVVSPYALCSCFGTGTLTKWTCIIIWFSQPVNQWALHCLLAFYRPVSDSPVHKHISAKVSALAKSHLCKKSLFVAIQWRTNLRGWWWVYYSVFQSTYSQDTTNFNKINIPVFLTPSVGVQGHARKCTFWS